MQSDLFDLQLRWSPVRAQDGAEDGSCGAYAAAEVTRETALGMLRQAAVGGGVGRFRRLLAQGPATCDVGMLDDDAVLDQLAGRIGRGEMQLLTPLRRPATRFVRPAYAPPLEETPAAPTVATPTTWVEVQLVDLAGEPVEGERCRITLPDGQVREARTNYIGRVRFDGLDTPGACEVTFPNLDTDAWERA